MLRKLKNFFYVYVREFSLVFHDQGLILFFLFLPIAYPVIYSIIYNPELVKEVDMVVVDSDRTPLSRELTRMFDACDEAHVIGYATDLSEARRAMDEHKAYAILEIPEGFDKKITRGETANGVLYCDMSLLIRYRGFLMASTNVMMEIGGELMTKDIDNMAPLAETVMTGDLMPIDSIPMGNIRSGFDSFIMPGMLILILQQSLMLALGMAGGAKRENPAMLGYNPVNIAPSTLSTMFAQSLCYLTIMIVPVMFMIYYVPLMFRFPMAGNLFEEFLFIVPFLLATFGMGYAYQAIVMEREQVFISWVFTSIVFLFLSGLIWPRYALPPVWKALSCVIPSSWGVEGFVKMNSNGASLSQVRTEYINLWILAGGWWIVGWCSRKWVVKRQIFKRSETNKQESPA